MPNQKRTIDEMPRTGIEFRCVVKMPRQMNAELRRAAEELSDIDGRYVSKNELIIRVLAEFLQKPEFIQEYLAQHNRADCAKRQQDANMKELKNRKRVLNRRKLELERDAKRQTKADENTPTRRRRRRIVKTA